jgi:hypothetical protein
MLERDISLSSSNCDQMQMNSDIPTDSSTFDVTQLLNFGGTDDATASSWLDMPQSLPNLDRAGPSEPCFSSMADHHSSLPDQHIHKTENTPPEEPWYPDPDLMEINYFDWDNDRVT